MQKEKLGLNVSDPGLWNGYHRPAFLQPTDPRFEEIASLYYKEMNKLYGKADYYSMDPFHEGGSVAGVDLDAAGKAIMQAMKKNNPKAALGGSGMAGEPASADDRKFGGGRSDRVGSVRGKPSAVGEILHLLGTGRTGSDSMTGFIVCC